MNSILWKDSSCYVSVKNELNETLTLVNKSSPWGHWEILPPRFINPNQTAYFYLKSDFWLGGTQGYVLYNGSSSTTFNFSFTNPSVAGESYSNLSLMGDNKNNYVSSVQTSQLCSSNGDWRINRCLNQSKSLRIGYIISTPISNSATDLSTYVIIENTSSATLLLVNHKALIGKWTVIPPKEITYRSNSIVFKILGDVSGSKGEVSYAILKDITTKKDYVEHVWYNYAVFIFKNLVSATKPTMRIIEKSDIGIGYGSGTLLPIILCRSQEDYSWNADYCDLIGGSNSLYVKYTVREATLPRKFSDGEMAYFNKKKGIFFPKPKYNFSYSQTWVISEPAAFYNCIGWSLGTLQNLQPNEDRDEATLEDFKKFYANVCKYKEGVNRCFEPAQKGDEEAVIDLWGSGIEDVTHASLHIKDFSDFPQITNPLGVSYPPPHGQYSDYFPNGTYTSKLSAKESYVLAHDRSGPSGNNYGEKLVASLKPMLISINEVDKMKRLDKLDAIEEKIKNHNYFSNSQKNYIRDQVKNVDPDIKQSFYKLYEVWEQDCQELLKTYSLIYRCGKLASIDALKALSSESIPLYIEKLADPGVMPLAIIPYKKIQEPELLPQYSASANDVQHLYESLEVKAIRLVDLWLADEGVV